MFITERCKEGDHDICFLDDCECDCHINYDDGDDELEPEFNEDSEDE